MHVCQNLLKATRDLSTRSTYVYSRNEDRIEDEKYDGRW